MSIFRNQSLEINDYTEDQIFEKDTFAIEMELQIGETDPDNNMPSTVNLEECTNTWGRTPTITEIEWMHLADKGERLDYYDSLKNYYRYRFPLWSDNHLSWWNHFHIFFKYWQTTKTLHNMSHFQIIKMQYFLMNVPLYAKPWKQDGKLYLFNRENWWFKPFFSHSVEAFNLVFPFHSKFNTKEKRDRLLSDYAYRKDSQDIAYTIPKYPISSWLKTAPFTTKNYYTGWTYSSQEQRQRTNNFISSTCIENNSEEAKTFDKAWSMSIEFRCNNVIDWRLYGYYLAAILYAMSDDDTVFYKIKPLKNSYKLFLWDEETYNDDRDDEEIPNSIHFDNINKKDFNLIEWTDLDYLKYNYTQMMKILNTCNLPNTTTMLQEYCSEIWLTN